MYGTKLMNVINDSIQSFCEKNNYRAANHNSSHKQQLHMQRINKYFDNKPEEWKSLHEFINGTEDVSLRLLYYLCAKYSARNSGVYYTHNGEVIDLFDRFQTAMSTRRLKAMDVFQRRNRIKITKHDITLTTTPAQLSFFEWAFSNGVIKYALSHREQISQSMKSHEKVKQKNSKKRKQTPSNKTTKRTKKKKIIPISHIVDEPEVISF